MTKGMWSERGREDGKRNEISNDEGVSCEDETRRDEKCRV